MDVQRHLDPGIFFQILLHRYGGAIVSAVVRRIVVARRVVDHPDSCRAELRSDRVPYQHDALRLVLTAGGRAAEEFVLLPQQIRFCGVGVIDQYLGRAVRLDGYGGFLCKLAFNIQCDAGRVLHEDIPELYACVADLYLLNRDPGLLSGLRGRFLRF